MELRLIDYNGFTPDDDGPATAAETEMVDWIEDYLRWRSERE